MEKVSNLEKNALSKNSPNEEIKFLLNKISAMTRKILKSILKELIQFIGLKQKLNKKKISENDQYIFLDEKFYSKTFK